MKKKNWAILFIVSLAVSFFISNPAYAGGWRFPLGLSYISGFSDVVDTNEDYLEEDFNATTDSVEGLPVGLSFRPYYEWDSGLGVGVDFGPMMLMFGDVDFFNLPVNVTCRYTINHTADTAAYGRLGVSHNFASGDYVENGKAGFFGAIGVEFKRNNPVGFGIEAAYDSSEIEFELVEYPYCTDSIKPGGFTVTFSVIF